MTIKSLPKASPLAAPLLVGLLLAGCSVTPEPFSAADVGAQAAADHTQIFAQQEPITGPISLEEALARALKYNLDQRLALMDAALQQQQLDLSNYDMLPRLAASAGYIARNNEAASLSRNTSTNFRSIEPATSQDRERGVADLGLSWNVLDFGLSYYQAKQQADRFLIAQERRRRVVNAIVQQVRASYWQAATAQRLQNKVTPVLAEARQALKDAQNIEAQRLRPLLETLRYQKALVEIIRQLEALEQELFIAKAQLAALMNLSPGEQYTLAVPPASVLPAPEIRLSLPEAETLALQNRPELMEERYQKRVTALEARKALLRLLPNLGLNGSFNYDSNSYLIHNSWVEASTRVTWNLLNVLNAPATKRVQEAQEQLGEMRRQALSMATLTQVHVGWQQFQRAREQYAQAVLLNDIEQRIFENVRQAEAQQAENALERIRSRASALTTELQRDRAYAEVQNALGNIYVSLGLDPLPAEVASHDLPTLARAIKAVSDDWQAGRLPKPVPVPAAETSQMPERNAPPSSEPVPVSSAPDMDPTPKVESRLVLGSAEQQ